MKKKFLSTRIISVLTLLFFCYLSFSQPKETAVKDISYTFSQTGGTNGCAVAWSPDKQIYITVIAGNISFPMEGFNSSGKNVFESETGFDWRGLWYNPSSKKFEGNGAGDYGWATFDLDASKKPNPSIVEVKEQNQPDFQSVGAYDYDKKMVVFYDGENGQLKLYSRKKPSKTSTIKLNFGNITSENINNTTVGYTGKKNYEFVLLDYYNSKLIFFNRKGNLTATTILPADAPMNYSFAFSFTNDRAFLYDKEFRVWRGYKVF
jgi:outer membrane lipoprotein-sorting protein